ncbi:hypothetical protein [Kordiimonas sp.]|uniref:hypothetical protein n=1 Tax=Kordiimonas sp. TaxID=1970157 RepID=UPI003A8D4387
MRKFFSLVFVSALLYATPATANQSSSNIMVEMFNWWNEAFKIEGSFTPEAFGKHFTDDAVMIIDGSVRATGLKELSRNFNRIQGSVESVIIKMPPIESFRQGDRIFTYHKELVHHQGQDSTGYVMGYVVVRDGKISKINFVNMNEDAARELSLRERAEK